MTPAAIAAGVETLLNSAIKLDPEISPRLAALDGSVIAIDLEGLTWTFYLLPSAQGIQVLEYYAGVPTVHIRGEPLALLRQWRSQRMDNDVRVEGDAAIGREFQRVLANLDVDWEEQFSKWVGDAAAHQISRFLRGVRDWRRHASDILLRDGAEFLQQEKRVLPSRYAVEQFLSGVDTLREDVDRLAARVERLRRQLLSGDSA